MMMANIFKDHFEGTLIKSNSKGTKIYFYTSTKNSNAAVIAVFFHCPIIIKLRTWGRQNKQQEKNRRQGNKVNG